MMTQAELPHMPAAAPPAAAMSEPPPAEAARRSRGPSGQLHLTTSVRWCVKDGPSAWLEGARARAGGLRRCSPPRHGRLRRQWLAGWDAADQLVQGRAAAWAEEMRAALEVSRA